MNRDLKTIFKKAALFMLLVILLIGSVPVFADVTYWLDSSAANNPDVKAAIEEAVPIYNKYGSFNKHLSVYYNPGIPTAEGNYDGYIGFGGSRNTRVALHEMGHTVGMGTYWGSPSYVSFLSGGVWQGFYGWKKAVEIGNGGLWGDGHAIWPGGMNYDNEDGFMERIKHVQIMAAIRCDMGILSYSKEAEHQIVPAGDTALFGVASPSAGTYQWYKDGVALTDGGDIAGATRSTLQIANVEPGDQGWYHCAAGGAGETLNSRPRRLIIQQQVGQWNFNGNPNDSVGSYHGIPSGSPAYITGKIGQAIDLDGMDDFITLPNGVADAREMTVAAWVYWDGGSQWQRIFDFGTSTSQNLFLTPRSGSNTLRFAIKNGGGEQIIETTQLPIGQWVHLAVTLRQDCAALYVNGRPVAAGGGMTLDPVDFSPDKNYLGKSQYADPLFNGRLDDFRIYNFALSGAQIWQLWGQNANNPPLFDADPLRPENGKEGVSYAATLAGKAADPDGDALTFTKISGPAWLNIAADGTLSGTPAHADSGKNTFVVRVSDPSGATDDAAMQMVVFATPDMRYRFDGTVLDSKGSANGTAAGSPTYVTGVVGQAIDLDGGSDYVILPAGILNASDFTIAAWVNWDGGNQWQRIFDFGNNTTQYMFLTPASGSGTLRFAITGSGNGTREQMLETAGLPVGQWVHVAVTLRGSTGRLYVNGQLRDLNAAMTIDPSDFNPAVNYIGKSQWPDALFNGRMDDLRIYKYALSDAEIAALSLPPAFVSDPISNLEATERQAYTGQPLTAFVDAPLGTAGLFFSKIDGPEWLAVAGDGTLSGIPHDAHVGENSFMVRVANQAGLFDTAELTIQVANIYSGVRGTEDLAGLAAQWLMLDCTDTPPCSGADLDGDLDVTFTDVSILARNWMADEE